MTCKFARHGTPFTNNVFQLTLESKAAHDHDHVDSPWPQVAGGTERFSYETFGPIAYDRPANLARSSYAHAAVRKAYRLGVEQKHKVRGNNPRTT